MNDALLCKWIRRFCTESEALWRRIIFHKYGCDKNGWDAKQTPLTYGMSLWRGVCYILEKFKMGIINKVGDERKTKFCFDRWEGNEVLKDKFPRILNISRKQHGWVSGMDII